MPPICVKGLAGLYWSSDNENRSLVSEVAPGRLVGDFSRILDDPRQLDLLAIENCIFLCIGTEELLAVIDNDVIVASSLLRSVAGNLTGLAANVQATRDYAKEHGFEFARFDKQ